MAEKSEILLEINVESKDALKNVERARLELARLKAEQASLNKQKEKGEITEEEYIAAMAKNRAEMMQQKQIIADNTKAYKDYVKAQENAEGSLVQLRGELSQLLKAYDALGAKERETAKGQDLLKAIEDTTKELKKAEEASGRFQRNVGNYQSVWDAPTKKIEDFGKVLKGVFDFDAQIAKLKGLGDAFKNVGATLDNARTKTIGFKKPTTDAGTASATAAASMRAEATAAGSVGDATQNATRQTIGFNTATNTSSTASKTAAAAETAQATAATGLSGALKTATSGMMSLLKATLKFIASPIGMVVAAIGAALLIVVKAVKQLTDAFKKNDDAMTALSSVMGVFKAIGAAIGKLFEYLVKAITPLIEGIGKLGRAIVSIIPGMKDYVKAQEDMVRSEDRLEEMHRQNLVQRAKDNKKLAELNNIVADSEHYTVEERKKAVEESIALEKQMTAAAVAEAREQLRIRKIKAQQDSDTSDETKNEIAQLEAVLIQLEADGEAAQRRAIARRSQFNKEIEQQRKEAAQKAAEQAKERREKEAEAEKALQDLILAQMKEGQEKEIALAKTNGERQVADLKKRLKEEKNLTAKARKAIQEQIVLIEAQTQVEIGKIAEKYNKENVQRQIAIANEEWKARLAVVRKGTEEERELRRQYEQEQAKQERDALINRLIANEITDEQYERLNELNRQKHLQNLAAIDKEAADAEQAAIKAEWDAKIAAEKDGSIAQMDVKIEAKKAEIEALRQLEGESDEAYKLRQQTLNNELVEMTKQRADAELKIEQGKAQATADLFGAISSIMEQAGEDNKAAVAASKVLALAQVAIQQGVAISEAVASAAAGDPYTYALRVASAIASTVAAMASAISSINEAKFATGGLVRGAGTSKSDSIPARLSNGEFVVNADSTRKHLAELVAINGGWGNTTPYNRHFAEGGVAGVEQYTPQANADAIAAAVREAIAGLQPVVSVKEITTVQNKVAVKERIANS